MEEERVRLQVGAADAAAQLVELREAEEVRVLHDERVDVWDVDAVLHDGRRDHHVRGAHREVDDPVLEVAQPRVGVRDGRVGQRLLQLLHLRLDLLDPGHHVEDLRKQSGGGTETAQQTRARRQGPRGGKDGAGRVCGPGWAGEAVRN